MLYFIIRYLLRYRLKTVRSNLRIAFPDCTDKQLRRTERDFYHHFADLIHESLLMNVASEKRMRRMLSFENMELANSIAASEGNMVCVFGHQCNWDLIAIAPLYTRVFDTNALYKKLHNDFFDRLFIKIRCRFGIRCIEHRAAARTILMAARNPQAKPQAYAFNTDQSPHSPWGCDWVNFFGVRTPAVGGWASIALKTGMPVIYLHITRTARMKYSVRIERIEERDHQAMLDKYYALLEDDIRRQPGEYLWSHRRWKYANI